jgi:hypothetical protein
MSTTRSWMWMTAAFAASVTFAADDVPSVGPGSAAQKALMERCAAMPSEARSKCMLEAEAADEKSGKHCENLTLRAREQCLADSRATSQQQASDQAAGGPQAGASTGGLPTPQTASPGEELKKPAEELKKPREELKKQ